jgi:hypothetical protein
MNPLHSFPLGEILSFGLWMEKQGYRHSTDKYCIQALKSIARRSYFNKRTPSGEVENKSTKDDGDGCCHGDCPSNIKGPERFIVTDAVLVDASRRTHARALQNA